MHRSASTLTFAFHPGVVFRQVVELNPATDVRGVTAITAAKIVKELAGIVSAHPYCPEDNTSEDGDWSVW